MLCSKVAAGSILRRGVPQWCFSKGFDNSAPLGPCVVSVHKVGDADGLRLRNLLNGEVRQDGNTNDLLSGVKAIVSFLSPGTIPKKGSLIMTGTPSGMQLQFFIFDRHQTNHTCRGCNGHEKPDMAQER